MKRTAIERRTPLARGEKKLGARSKSHPRRTRHPLPLPTGKPITLAELEGEAVAFGPQAALCRRTECAACFAVRWWREAGRRSPIPWTLLASGPSERSHAHHEPHRSTRGDSHDEDTYPLCPKHHYEGVGDMVRHRVGYTDEQNARRFYYLLPFDWRAAVAEMRRRTALAKPAALAAERTP